MAFRYQRTESVADGLRRIAREQAEQALASATASDRNPTVRVHDVRKRTKKLRSLLRLVRPSLGEFYRVENSYLRDAARRLSSVRDAEVLLTAFDGLVKKQPAGERENLSVLREQLVRKLADQQSPGDVNGQLAVFANDIRELLERIDEWRLEGGDFAAIGVGLCRSYRDGRQAMEVARCSSNAADWHEWRKRVKDHWYHIRLLRNIWKQPMRARQRELETLSDLLGNDHDLAVLHERVVGLSDLPAELTSRLLDAIGLQRAKLQTSARPLGARIYAEKPGALTKRVRCYWRTWRQ